MSLTPLFDAGFLISSHALTAIAAFILGIVQFLAPKGTLPHRTLGYVWCILMLWIAGSSLFIHTIRLWGPFSPIHILSVATLYSVIAAIWHARRGDVKKHRSTIFLIFGGGLIVAGLFTLLPGRIMHEVLLGAS